MKHITLFSSQALLIALMALAAGCGPFGKAVDTEPDLTGQVTEIERIRREGILGRVLVEARVVEGTPSILRNTWSQKSTKP